MPPTTFQTNPPLTPMERRLLDAIERLETDWQDRETRLLRRMAEIEARLATQDALIAGQSQDIDGFRNFFATLLHAPSMPSSAS